MVVGYLFAALTAILFVTMEPVSKLISADVSPFAITFIRFFISGVIILPIGLIRLRKKGRKLPLKTFFLMALLGTIMICASMIPLQYAVKLAESPALISVLFSANSITTILLSALVLKNRLTPAKCLAMLLCALGILICMDFRSGSNLFSVFLALIAGLFFSLYTVLGKKLFSSYSGTVQAGIGFFFGSLVLLVILLCFNIPVFTRIHMNAVPHLLYLGIFVTGVGYLSYFKAMEKGGPFAAALTFFIKPVLTPFAALLINGVIPSVEIFIAIVLIVSGSVLNAWSEKRR